jgi:hypothetical protein
MDCLANTPFLKKNLIKPFFSLAYPLIILGSIGMMLFASKFPLSSCIRDLESCNERLCGLNGYQVWKFSWLLIIAGTVMQFIWFFIDIK